MLALLLLASGLTAAQAAMAASPASAEVCGTTYWWASVSASNHAHERMVLAVEPDWEAPARAYIWEWNNDPQHRQEWRQTCPPDDTTGNFVQLHIAHDDSSCLEKLSTSTIPALRTCNDKNRRQWWQRVPGPSRSVNGASRATYTWHNSTLGSGYCLDVYQDLAANGTWAITFPCTGGDNQLWYRADPTTPPGQGP